MLICLILFTSTLTIIKSHVSHSLLSIDLDHFDPDLIYDGGVKGSNSLKIMLNSNFNKKGRYRSGCGRDL
jgi:hypothetical protein